MWVFEVGYSINKNAPIVLSHGEVLRVKTDLNIDRKLRDAGGVFGDGGSIVVEYFVFPGPVPVEGDAGVEMRYDCYAKDKDNCYSVTFLKSSNASSLVASATLRMRFAGSSFLQTLIFLLRSRIMRLPKASPATTWEFDESEEMEVIAGNSKMPWGGSSRSAPS